MDLKILVPFILYQVLVVAFLDEVPEPGILFPAVKIRGRAVENGEFPFQVSLQYKCSHKHFCGGVILDKNHVLTAAKCVYMTPMSEISVVGGCVVLTDPDLVRRNAEEAFVHEQFDYGSSCDIALLRISGDFPLDNVILSVATLQTKREASWTYATISGWHYDKQEPRRLYAFDVPLISERKCAQYYKNMSHPEVLIGPGMFCAGPPPGSTDPCQGDIGGPLMMVEDSGTIVVGIASSRDPHCAYLGVFTVISEFNGWIRSNIKKSRKKLKTNDILSNTTTALN